MSYDAEKLELIRWLMDLEDENAISYLKVVKDTIDAKDDWWIKLPDITKSGILRGLDDVKYNKVHDHETIKLKYGL